MTIALLIKVNDGIVLASDSATTLTMRLPDGSDAVGNIYNNANKVFNLHKGLPVGGMTWGLGNIGPASIATLTKDLRRRFQGDDHAHPDWTVADGDYEVRALAEQSRQFLYDGRYQHIESAAQAAGETPPVLGFLVAGYSSADDVPKCYMMHLGAAGVPELEEVVPEESGAAWWGQPEAIARILTGLSLAVPDALLNLDIGLDPAQSLLINDNLKAQLNPQMVPAAMPIQDAIDLAEFLVHATIQFVRFSPGSPTVGGPIEIATITKHEGFRWVRRKHFFESRLNPTNGG
ncbi:hypothetical protein A20C1_09544 [marine actinobacterium PHSC20C1]|nr:hypothetical protein A20C1_09544 [marine actinobacterium PHSC20C1]